MLHYIGACTYWSYILKQLSFPARNLLFICIMMGINGVLSMLCRPSASLLPLLITLSCLSSLNSARFDGKLNSTDSTFSVEESIFQNFIQKFNKTYARGSQEYSKRYRIFKVSKNMEQVLSKSHLHSGIKDKACSCRMRTNLPSVWNTLLTMSDIYEIGMGRGGGGVILANKVGTRESICVCDGTKHDRYMR